MEFDEIVDVIDRGNSADVTTNSTFDSLMISPRTLERLKVYGFNKPSPVQEKAIPVGLLGLDMLVQAKSGTGKTLVFSVLAVENVDISKKFVQKLIVGPTREISLQITETIKKLAPKGTKVSTFVGGIPLRDDITSIRKQKPHIVVGTTGRLCQLIDGNYLSISNVDFLALDEADKLMEQCFQKEINYMVSCLPQMRQIVVLSATYPRELDVMLTKYLRNASLVRFNSGDVQLIGIKQYVITGCSPLNDKLVQLFRKVQFSQALVFCDNMEKCEPTCSRLVSEGFEATYITGSMSQKQRYEAIDQLRNYKVKILVSSDLTARGIDADRVNFVVNLDAAINPETYFHRIGRAARFGGKGAAVTLVENDQSLRCFTAMAAKGKINVKRVRLDDIPYDLTINVDFFESSRLFFKEREKMENNDIDCVPPREVAEETLKRERNSNGTFYSYTRDEMIEIKDIVSKDSKTVDDQENAVKGNSNNKNPKKDFKVELNKLKSIMSDSKNKNDSDFNEEDNDEKTKEETKKEFKFVPTRTKAKIKYYMRGELLRIRESATPKEWRIYAENKLDMTSAPFLSKDKLDTKSENKKVNEKKKKKEKSVTKNDDSRLKKQKSIEYNDGVQRYNRKEMIKIQMSIPKTSWVPYVKSKYNTKEEPWELNQEMRCSFEERLRKIRAKEKAERKKVMEDRKKARFEHGQIFSSGRYLFKSEVAETSFQSFVESVRNDFEKFKIENDKNEQKIKFGSVVFHRDSPEDWKKRVFTISKSLYDSEKQFSNQISKKLEFVSDFSQQTDEADKKSYADSNVQTDPIEIEEENESFCEEEEEEFEYHSTNRDNLKMFNNSTGLIGSDPSTYNIFQQGSALDNYIRFMSQVRFSRNS